MELKYKTGGKIVKILEQIIFEKNEDENIFNAYINYKKNKYFVLGYIYLLSNNDKLATKFLENFKYCILNNKKEDLIDVNLEQVIRLYEIGLNLQTYYKERKININKSNCTKKEVYINLLLGYMHFNKNSIDEFNLIIAFRSIPKTEEKIFEEFFKDTIQIGKYITIKEET